MLSDLHLKITAIQATHSQQTKHRAMPVNFDWTRKAEVGRKSSPPQRDPPANHSVPDSRGNLNVGGRIVKRENSPEPIVKAKHVSSSTIKLEDDDSDVEFMRVTPSTTASTISSKRPSTAGSRISLKRRREPLLPSSIGSSFDSVEHFKASLGIWYNENFDSFPGLRYTSDTEQGTCKMVTAICERKRECKFMVRMESMLHGLGYQVTKACTSHSNHCSQQAEASAATKGKQLPNGTGPPVVGTSYRSFEIFRGAVKDWHVDRYPDRSIIVRRAVRALGGRPAATCSQQEKGRIVCGFSIVARSLGEGRYTVIQADTTHSSACNEVAMNSGPSRPITAEASSPTRNTQRNHSRSLESPPQIRINATTSDSSDEEPLSKTSRSMSSIHSRPQTIKTTNAGKADDRNAPEHPVANESASRSGPSINQPQPLDPRPPPDSKWVEVQEPLTTLAPYMRTRFALHGITTTENLLDAGIETCEQFTEAVRQVCKLEPHTQGSMAEIATYFTLRAYQ